MVVLEWKVQHVVTVGSLKVTHQQAACDRRGFGVPAELRQWSPSNGNRGATFPEPGTWSIYTKEKASLGTYTYHCFSLRMNIHACVVQACSSVPYQCENPTR